MFIMNETRHNMRLPQMNYKKLYQQLVGFFIAGCIANIVSFTVYFFSFNFINLKLFLSSILGQIFGLGINYLINSRFVFMKKLNIKFKIIYFIYYITNIYLVSISIESLELFGVNYIYSWFICVVIAAIVNFLFVKYLAFKK